MLKHFSLRRYLLQWPLLAMMVVMVVLKPAPFVRQPIETGCENGMTGTVIQSMIAVTAKREIGDKVTEETRYFISSLDASDPKRLERVVRAHWAIENNLHWVLDVAFDEDSNRTRSGHSAANLAVIRHIALNLIKTEKTSKVGVKIKRLKAGWDNDYLLRILGVI